jgi:hypothetical protein
LVRALVVLPTASRPVGDVARAFLDPAELGDAAGVVR